MKKGLRESVRKLNKDRMEEVKSIIDDMDDIAVALIKSLVPISKDNLREEAEKHTHRKLGKLELALILSKLKNFEAALEEKRLTLHGKK